MSKDKGGKNVKKAPGTTVKKSESDYQACKKSIGTSDQNTNKKK